MKRVSLYAAVGCVLLQSIFIAAPARAHEGHYASGAVAMTNGVVQKIDKTGGWVKLAHDPIVNLDMAAMTMTFKVRKPESLANLKEGDKVRFRAESVNGALTVAHIEAAK